MNVDVLSIAARALEFVTLLQAVGVALFCGHFRGHLEASEPPLRLLAWGSALLAAGFVVLHHGLEAARMSGEISGIADMSLQARALATPAGVADVLKLAGLLMIAGGLSGSQSTPVVALLGAALACAAFLFAGHSSRHALRWLLAPLLLVHLLVSAFWFGSILPIVIIVRVEAVAVAAGLIAEFSRLAAWLVPLIAVAGLTMAYVLTQGTIDPSNPYDRILALKLLLFALLLGIAALNKYRLGPAIAAGRAESGRRFKASLYTEYAVIAVVAALSAVLTGLFSP